MARRLRTSALAAHGVPFLVEAPEDLGDRLTARLPPAVAPHRGAAPRLRFGLIPTTAGGLRLEVPGETLIEHGDEELVLDLLESQVRLHVGEASTEAVFFHAGVVAHRGGALLLPGRSFAGKSTLVRALLAAGADYLSDELALVADDGTVRAYPKPLSLRDQDGRPAAEVDAATLGARIEPGPVPVRLVAVLQYERGADFAAREVGKGPGALKLIEQCLQAQARPAAAMAAAAAVVQHAAVLEGVRGEADAAAAVLLGQLAASSA